MCQKIFIDLFTNRWYIYPKQKKIHYGIYKDTMIKIDNNLQSSKPHGYTITRRNKVRVALNRPTHKKRRRGDETLFLEIFQQSLREKGRGGDCSLREGFDSKNPRVFLFNNFNLKKKYDQVFQSNKKYLIVFYSKNEWA